MNKHNFFILLSCLFFLFFSACGTYFNSASNPHEKLKEKTTANKDTGKQEKESTGETKKLEEEIVERELEEMDTVSWVDLEENPIGISKVGSGFLEEYKIAVILPFYSEQFRLNTLSVKRRSHKAIQFYGGMKIALDKLEQENGQIRLKILDNNGDKEKTKALFEDEFVQEAQVIIGPFLSRNVSAVAEQVKQSKQTFISPYNARGKLTSENPYFIQVRPSLKKHVEKILNHLTTQGDAKDIIMIGQDSSESKRLLGYFQECYINGVEGKDSLSTCMLDAENYLVGEDTLYCLMGEIGEVKPLIIASADERFVYAALRRIAVEADKTGTQYEIYGMPQWRNFQNIDFDLFEKLKIRISAYDFVDRQSTEVIAFRTSFKQQYGIAPDIEAYLGFDVMNYVSKMLRKYGTDFPKNMDVEPMEGLHTSFNFTAKYPEGDDRFEKIEYYENGFINILKFEGYHYQLAE